MIKIRIGIEKNQNKKESLTKKLKELEKELINLLKELSKFRKENKEFLKQKLNGKENIKETIKYYKEKINLAFDFNKLSIKNAKQAINDFKKISKEDEHLIELMVYYVETGTKFERETGDLWEAFYTSIENMFKNCIKILNKNKNLIPLYEKRLEKIIKISCDGYGHRDILEEMLEDLER